MIATKQATILMGDGNTKTVYVPFSAKIGMVMSFTDRTRGTLINFPGDRTMKARDLINLCDRECLGNIVKLSANKYSYLGETLTFRGLCSTLEEMGVQVSYL